MEENIMDYNVEIKRDVFIEFGEQVCVNYARYLRKNGITLKDAENPVVNKYRELITLVNNAYNIETEEEIIAANKQLDEIRRYYRELQ